jgi:outer membrane protein TolC
VEKDAGHEVGVDALVEEALERNPDLKAAEARWQMFERKVVPAGSLDDPMVSFSMTNYPVDTLEAGETPMTGNDLKLSQKFPFPGKLGTREEVAEQQALWYEGAYEDARLQLRRKVKDSWFKLFFQDRAIGVLRKNIEILDDFIHLTETRYEVGKGLQQDVLKAQVERSKLMDRLFNLQQRRESLQADLNTLLARPSTTTISTPDELAITRVDKDLEELQKGSESHRPLYASYTSLIDRFKAQRKLAKLDYWPDINLWAGYRFREETPGDPVDGTDFVSGGVAINLPIWRKKRAQAVAEAESGTRMALRQFDDFRDKVYFEIHDAYAQMEKDRNLVALYKTGIVPQANQTFQSSMAAYRVGKVDFLSLLDSLLKLYSFETDYFRVLSDYERDVARLEAASGMEFAKAGSGEASK